jgi:thiol-disulfide isomerase/thioredoxin
MQRFLKMFLPLIFGFLFTGLCGQSTIKVICKLEGGGNSLFLYEFNGFGFSPKHSVSAEKAGYFVMEVPRQAPRMFYIGQNSEQVIPIILGGEDGVEITGTAENIGAAVISNSAENEGYQNLKMVIGNLNNEMGEILRGLSEGNAANQNQLVNQLAGLDAKKLYLLDSLKKTNALQYRVMALNAYQSFQLNNNGNRYPDELSYFINEFFAKVDFSDPGYDHLIWLYESFRTYVNVLVSAGVVEEQVDLFIENIIGKTPEGSHARLQCLGASIAVMQAQKHPLLVKYGNRFVNEFQDKAPQAAMEISEMLEKTMRLMEGAPAPEFSQISPEGTPIQLSDFKGKYVLLDFWASWCGPCRKENPNVVRLYNKYKNQGFEILGISLDQNRERWLQAIQADKLTWKHTSDLKGWSNEVGKLYEISAIPKTFLLDPKGIIIAKDLRGAALEGKLAQIFSAATPSGGN